MICVNSVSIKWNNITFFFSIRKKQMAVRSKNSLFTIAFSRIHIRYGITCEILHLQMYILTTLSSRISFCIYMKALNHNTPGDCICTLSEQLFLLRFSFTQVPFCASVCEFWVYSKKWAQLYKMNEFSIFLEHFSCEEIHGLRFIERIDEVAIFQHVKGELVYIHSSKMETVSSVLA